MVWIFVLLTISLVSPLLDFLSHAVHDHVHLLQVFIVVAWEIDGVSSIFYQDLFLLGAGTCTVQLRIDVMNER